MQVFKFKTKEDFDKAVRLLRTAVGVSPDYDHSVQDEKTITVIKVKNADLIEKALEKQGIKFEKEEDFSWASPTSSTDTDWAGEYLKCEGGK
jgi:hypothetical protein